MKFSFTSILLISCFELFAQNLTVDSLNALITQNPDDSLMAIQLRLLGVEYKKLGKLDEAISLYTQAAELNNKHGNQAELAKCFNNLGSVYGVQGEYEKALHSYLESLRINEELKDYDGQIKNNINIGNFFARQRSFEKALGYYSNALTILDSHENLREEAFLNMNMGGVYTDPYNSMADPDKAVEHFQKAKEVFEKLKDSINIAGISNNLGIVKEQQQKFDEALSYYNEALNLSEQITDFSLSAQVYHNIGSIYRKLDQLPNAIRYYKKSLDASMKIGAAGSARNALLSIAGTLAKNGQHEEAYGFRLQYEDLKDSLLNEEKTRQLAELEMKYETQKKEQELVVKEASLKQKTAERNTYMITLAITIVLSIAIIAIYQQRQQAMSQLTKKNEELHQQQVTDLLRDHEIKSINAMLEGQDRERKRIAEDLHDRLGSTLSAVKLNLNALDGHMVGSPSLPVYEKVDELLDKAVKEVRDIAHNMVSGVLTKFGLSAALQDLKETIEASKQIKVELNILHVDERLEGNVEINLYRIIQELVSNVLKHAMASEIVIQINKMPNEIILMVEDNGVGFSAILIQQGKGMGMRNVESRVNTLGGKIYFDSSPGNGTTVSILIPTT